MLYIKEEAEEPLEELLRGGSDGSAVRVAVMGGARGAGLALIIDEPTEDDLQIDHKGIAMIIDRNLMAYCKSITIGFRKSGEQNCTTVASTGFLIEPEISLQL